LAVKLDNILPISKHEYDNKGGREKNIVERIGIRLQKRKLMEGSGISGRRFYYANKAILTTVIDVPAPVYFICKRSVGMEFYIL
jgi:hypothetical protein